ncbi:hypothetical protein [Algisphaera agarilytica]|uniref:Uncharacterized protein n=1 Tax=Algisphaera agarilytica TaxID=1385975 RepID=A0A7X0H4Z2_9BACT|nr:hypothetical protein [Algisphaera agarilytica]MBB6429193.1 hypothetical protein [Algisphaera agarilytica]
MGWTTKQVRIANQAAREAGLVKGKDTSRKDLLLRQLDGRAWDDRAERFSTRCSELTNSDFEWFMARCEEASDDDRVGGQPPFYWHHAEREGDWKRKRFCVQERADELANAYGTAYVDGVIRKAIGPWSGDLDNCDTRQLEHILNALNRDGHNTNTTTGKDSPADAEMALPF